jgi:hypothetical protein
MSDGGGVSPELQARVYHAALQRLLASGRSPHYVELAPELGVSPDEARDAVRSLGSSGLPFLVQPETDYILGASPLSAVPTPCRIAIDGRPGWYAI